MPARTDWISARGEPTVTLLLRHGQTSMSVQKRYAGRTDAPLTDTGIRQAVAAAKRLASAGVDAIGTSPLQRAVRTAGEVAAARRVSGVFTAPVVDADPAALLPWLVTGFVNGLSLAEAVDEHGALPVASVLALAAGLVEGLVTRFRRELGDDMKVIATGGLAESVAAESPLIQHVDPWLTLEGLRLIWGMNQH